MTSPTSKYESKNLSYSDGSISNSPIEPTSKANFQKRIKKIKISQASSRIGSNQNNSISPNTLKKIITVALIVLVLFGLFIPVSAISQIPSKNMIKRLPENSRSVFDWHSHSNNKVCQNTKSYTPISNQLQPYSNSLYKTTNPTCAKNANKFPKHLPKAMHPGFMSGGKGDLCFIPLNEKMPTFNKCAEVVSEIKKLIPRETHLKLKEQYKDPKISNEKGLHIHVVVENAEISDVSLGMSPKKEIYYNDALKFIEKTVLNNPHFLTSSESEIIESIKKTNQLVCQTMNLNGGKYRNGFSIVLDDKTDGPEGMAAVILEKGGSRNDVKILKNFLSKNDETISKEELRVLKLVGFIPTLYPEIEKEMKVFAKVLKEIASRVVYLEIDPIGAAAFVHQEIGRIHPFEEGNGRTARIWTNVILQLGGVESVIFPNDDAYTAAIIDDQSHSGKFTSYLEDIIEWNRRQSFTKQG